MVKKSTIPGAGLGLFTRVAFRRGDQIIEYKGRLCLWREVKHEDATNPYLMRVSRTHAIDCLKRLSSLGRYANDANGLSRIPGVRNNADFISYGNRCYIEAIRSIPAGSEILVGYGREFWKVHGGGSKRQRVVKGRK